jgi:hypothetical protein
LNSNFRIFRAGNSLTNNAWLYLPRVGKAGGYNNILGISLGGAGVGTKWLWENHIEKPSKPERDYRPKINDGAPYDFVITQPWCSWGEMDLNEEMEYTSKFYDLVLAVSPKADLWLYSQWKVWEQPADLFKDDRNNTEKEWLAGMGKYIKSFDELRDRLQAKYPGHKIRIIPVAQAVLALQKAIKEGKVPGIKNYEREIMSDGIHFGSAGCYFISLVYYACFYGKSPVGLVVADTGLTIEQQEKMQEIAWETMKNCKWAGITK